MRHQVSGFLDNAITFLLLLVAGVTPLLFLNLTTEFYEIPKLFFLLITVVLLYALWIFSWVLKGKVVITKTPLDIPMLVLMGIVLLSTYFSVTKYAAIYGTFPRVHGSSVSWIVYILLYFVTVSHLKSIARIKTFLYVIYGSAFVVAIVTLLSFFKVYLPFEFARAVNFTPTGSTFSTVAFLLMLLPLPLLSIGSQNKYFPLPLSFTLALVFGVTVVLTGNALIYIGLLVIFLLSLFALRTHQGKRSVALLVIPVVVLAATLLLAYVPVAGNQNPIQQLVLNFPREVQLPLGISWKISASTFRDAPFIGSGPSTYLFNLTSYKPLEYNQQNFWNFSFDTAHNEFLQVLGTMGMLGFAALALVCLVVLNHTRRNLSLDNPEAAQDNTHVLLPALAISGIVSVYLLAIHATTLVSVVVMFFVLAAFMVSQRSVREGVMELSMGLKASTSDNKQFDLLPVIIFILFLIVAVPVGYRAVNAASADYYHRLALSQADKNGALTYEYLQKAERLNPYIDLYRVDMAQTNFALANAIALKARPTDDATQVTLSAQDRQTIQTLLSQAVNEGRASVALSPRSARNYEVLASIYRNIAGVAQNALAFSLDAYGRAIQRDPLNPALRVNVGGIYYVARNYDLAIRFFSDAANLKPDYANAYYNLSIALRDKGDLQNARTVAERTVNLLAKNKESDSYKTAAKLLDDLKASIATGSAATGEPAPAAQTSSALNNPNLPEVNVGTQTNAPSVTPVPSVRPNPTTNLPQVNTTPRPTATP